MAIPESLSDIWATFDRLMVPHTRMDAAHAYYDSLRRIKIKSPKSPKGFATLFAPTQSGKSTTIKSYIETTIVDEAIRRGLFSADLDRETIAEEQKIVIHVTLSSKATPRSLAVDILTAFGDPHASRGTEGSLLQRVYDYMRHHRTELLFVDEIQHLSIRKNRGNDGRAVRSHVLETTSVTDALKVMLIRGLVPMVMVGIPEAKHHLFNDKQLASRCMRELDFDPLDFQAGDARTIFTDFIGRLGATLNVTGFFGGWSLLLTDDIPVCLHAVSGGRLGMVANILRVACEMAFEEGADRITRAHLENATERWAIPRDIVDYNPFVDGVRELSFAA